MTENRVAAGGVVSGINLDKRNQDKSSSATVSVTRRYRWNDLIIRSSVMVDRWALRNTTLSDTYQLGKPYWCSDRISRAKGIRSNYQVRLVRTKRRYQWSNCIGGAENTPSNHQVRLVPAEKRPAQSTALEQPYKACGLDMQQESSRNNHWKYSECVRWAFNYRNKRSLKAEPAAKSVTSNQTRE